MPSRFVVRPNNAPHHWPSAYHSFDWAELVVGRRTTVGSTAKSANVSPAGGGGSGGPVGDGCGVAIGAVGRRARTRAQRHDGHDRRRPRR